MKAVTIRSAEPRDMPGLIELGRKFFDQSGNSAFAVFDDASFAGAVSTILSGTTAGTLLVAESDDGLVGMAASVFFPSYFNLHTKMAQEMFCEPKPDHQNGIGRSLVEELEADAVRKGADVFMTTSIAGLSQGTIVRVHEHRAYRALENTFTRKILS